MKLIELYDAFIGELLINPKSIEYISLNKSTFKVEIGLSSQVVQLFKDNVEDAIYTYDYLYTKLTDL
jgi:hypothetical protein